MLKTIIEKEIRDLIGSTKFAITFGACAFLIIGSFYAGAARYGLYRQQYEAAKAQEMQQIETNTDWNEVGEARAFLPPEPLATLVSGVSNDIGRTATVTGRGEPAIQDSRYSEDPIYAVFQFLDLEFVFAVILSLFAILLGYDAISGEKEQGTLRLAFANSVPRHIYIAGKLLGAFGVLAVSLLVALAAGALLFPAMGVPMSGADWGALGLIVLTGFLYFGVFLTLAIAVSSLTQRPSSSFLILLVVWIAAVLIIPRVAVLTAGRAVAVPSVDEIASQKTRYAGQLRQEYFDALSSMAIDMSGDADPIQKLNGYMDSLTGVRQAKMDELSGRLNEQRHNAQEQQGRLALSLARCSPTASLNMAISQLAGTSLALNERFYQEALQYGRQFGEFKREKTGFNSGASLRVVRLGDGAEEEERQPLDPQELPQFAYNRASTAECISAAAADIGLLAFFNLLFFAGAFVAFSRYDLR